MNKYNKIISEIEKIRDILLTEDMELGDGLETTLEEQVYSRTLNYFNNQIANLTKYGHTMRKLCTESDLAPSFIDTYIEELEDIKKEFNKSMLGLYQLKRDPTEDFNGYLINLFTRTNQLKGSIRKLVIVRKTLEKAYDGIDKTEK